MKSLQTSIYDYEEVLITLAWLSNCSVDMPPRKVVNNAIRLGLITVYNERHWRANANNIFRRLDSFMVKFPRHNQIADLKKILIGVGEFSARSHGNFSDILSKKFSTFFYKRTLQKILKEVVETKHFLQRKRNLEELGFFQKIANTNFDSKGYDEARSDLSYGMMSTHNYGLAFIVDICIRVVPRQFSACVKKYKGNPIIGDLCAPAIKPLMFRDQKYITPLLKSKNAYLKLLACASVVQQEPFDNQSTIDENIKILVTNGVGLGDAIWLSSVKLREHYQSVERVASQITSTRLEILRCKKDPSSCPNGIGLEQWVSSRKDVLREQENLLVDIKDRLKTSFDGMMAHWPKPGIEEHQIENIIHIIRDEKLCRELVEIVPSETNKEQILEGALSSVFQWIGISSKPTLEVCEETFYYSSTRDLQRIVVAAKTLVLLSNVKGKIIGRFLGSAVMHTVQTLEKFSSGPCMNVRKPNLWQSATSRLACIHLLAMCVFEETPEGKENEISKIVPAVVERINFLLKIKDINSHAGDDLFKDLKRITAHIISSKSYLEPSSEKIATDAGLPPDYRARVIVSDESLIKDQNSILLELFEEFSAPPIYFDRNYKHFSSWVCLLDICIAHCWKFNATQEAKDIIRIWEKYCPLYGNECNEYFDYAKKLFLALSDDGEEREWLIGLYGFEQSNCINFIR